jgi:K+-sensing histidine kinase KdpD
MEAIQTVFRDVREKHPDNTQIQQILNELQDQMGHVLTEHLKANTQDKQSGASQCPETQKMKHYAHHCLRPEVINNLSHKVKTPLTAIISGIQLLYNYDHEECVLRIMDYLMQSSIELTQFVNDIMDLYYITQDKFDIEYELVNLGKLIEYVYSVYALQMQEENINFHYDVDKQIPETIITDKKRLIQILINLFSNAIKSFDYDQNNKQIYIAFNAITQTRLKINIRDTGRGIDLQSSETLFDPFYKTDNTEGIGLGLTICRLLVKKIGSGTIQFVEPLDPNFSTELVAEFDIKKEHRQPHRPTILTRNIQEPIVVIIDDNTTNLDLLKIIIKNIIEKNGYTLTIKPFNDPCAAKSFILANMSNIILCMVDMKMPKLTGTELIRGIYDSEGTDGIIPFSIIILSALTRNYITDQITELPEKIKNNIIISSKPYNMQDIEKHIISALKSKICRSTMV